MTGILGGTGGILFIYAYRLLTPSKLAPFEYFGIPSSFILGWIFFKEAPINQLFPGVLAIVLAGMIIIWRDAKKENHDLEVKKPF
jgi:drug/metabolite transporter (DMT)-like permease